MSEENQSPIPTPTKPDYSAKIRYLSPTSLGKALNNTEEFFLNYMAKAPREEQTIHMAAGNAFDSCVKAYLELWSEGEVTSAKHLARYEEHLKKQVSASFYEAIHKYGIIIFNMYKQTGALENLLADIQPGSAQPLDEVEGVIGGVPWLGKPDFSYISKKHACKVVTDWKCNGAMTTGAVSPIAGYIDIFPSRGMHKNCDLVNGVNILDMHPTHELQLTIYKLLVDAEIVGIDQLVFGASNEEMIANGTLGDLRVAIFRHRVSEDLIKRTLEAGQRVWSAIQGWEPGKSFLDISAERCDKLCEMAQEFQDPVVSMLSGRKTV